MHACVRAHTYTHMCVHIHAHAHFNEMRLYTQYTVQPFPKCMNNFRDIPILATTIKEWLSYLAYVVKSITSESCMQGTSNNIKMSSSTLK